MPAVSTSPVSERRHGKVVRAFATDPSVTVGAGCTKGFGVSALSTNAKIFAMLSSRSRFADKLPKASVDTLLASGQGARFGSGHGRLMKEWLALAREARAFAAARP